MHPVAQRLALALLVCAPALAAAQRPDFAGTWVRDDSAAARIVASAGDAAFPRGNMGAGWGSPLSVTQSADQLTVVFDFFIAYDLQPKVRYTYLIGGTESKNTVNVGNAPVEVRSVAAWKGDTLEITSTFPVPPGIAPRAHAPDLTQRLWLRTQGRLMIEARRQGAGALVNSVLTSWTKR